jgi:hypothetical protein
LGLHQILGTDSKSYFQKYQKEELGLRDNCDLNHHLQSLTMIEKAINFLKRKFDRFKTYQFYENLSEVKKLLNIEKVDYGIQLLDKKFILLKHKKKSKWKEMAEYFLVSNIIKTELSMKKKTKKRKFDIIVNLLNIPLFDDWRMKEGIIYQIIKKENIDELFLWNIFLRSKKKRKIRLKPYISEKHLNSS